MTAPTMETLASIATATVAVIGVRIAWLGLNTWREQQVWQADHELARKALIALYRYRDSLYMVRHPAMLNDEMRLEGEEAEGMNADQRRRQGVIAAYSRRWERHSVSRNELDAILIEADAVWDTELTKLIRPLKELERELFVFIQLHFDANYRNSPDLQQSYREILRNKRDILYDLMTDEDDFRKDFTEQLRNVENYLRKKLGRKQ